MNVAGTTILEPSFWSPKREINVLGDDMGGGLYPISSRPYNDPDAEVSYRLARADQLGLLMKNSWHRKIGHMPLDDENISRLLKFSPMWDQNDGITKDFKALLFFDHTGRIRKIVDGKQMVSTENGSSTIPFINEILDSKPDIPYAEIHERNGFLTMHDSNYLPPGFSLQLVYLHKYVSDLMLARKLGQSFDYLIFA